jgi:DNA-binding transcriptional LysR family regulator
MRQKRARLPIEPAAMQGLNWNDLRYILAVGEEGRSAAARLLRVDDTTVARRLAAVQERLVPGTSASRDGTLQLTPSGECAALHAERIERQVGLLNSALSGVPGRGRRCGSPPSLSSSVNSDSRCGGFSRATSPAAAGLIADAGTSA